MTKKKKMERLLIMGQVLFTNPGKLYSLSYFEQLFSIAKSTVSEDISLLKETMQVTKRGELQTISGAMGGLKYNPWTTENEKYSYLINVADLLNRPDRILPGDFLYISDLIFDPFHSQMIGRIFATIYKETQPDYIVTVETKGIPIALMTAQVFGVPLVLIRDHSRVTEGSSVNINYLSGSSNKIQTMSLSRRAMPENANVLLIDDFMKGGGTLQGALSLMKEFNAQVKGIGVLLSTVKPEKKLVENYQSLLFMDWNSLGNKGFILPNMK